MQFIVEIDDTLAQEAIEAVCQQKGYVKIGALANDPPNSLSKEEFVQEVLESVFVDALKQVRTETAIEAARTKSEAQQPQVIVKKKAR